MMEKNKSKRWIDYYQAVTQAYNVTRNAKGFIPHEVHIITQINLTKKVFWGMKPYAQYALPGTKPIPSFTTEELEELEASIPNENVEDEEIHQIQLTHARRTVLLDHAVAKQQVAAEKVVKRSQVIILINCH